jgi:vacuolar protein sorting-associated protein 11
VKNEQRLVDLIKNYSQFYDDNHVLVLCKTYEFWLGAMLIYEEKKLYNLIVRHYLATKDYTSLYVLCKRLGTVDPAIWLYTLNGLKNNNQVPSSFLQEILQVIALEKLQSPLQVLGALAAIENGPNLSSVRHYFTQIFQKEGEVMARDEVAAEKHRQESEALKKNIHVLNNEPVEFRGSLCDACHQPLNLPALFFLCKHSFHQECIRSYSETEKDCMVCRKKNMNLQDMMHKQNESRNKNNLFKEQLVSSHEPFSVVADYYSRGLFNKIVLLSDDDDDTREAVIDDLNIPKKPMPQKSTLKAAMAMTEGKTRIEETLRMNVDTKPQLSEGRMRLLEQSSRSKPQVIPVAPVQQVNKKIEVKSKVPVTYPISANPFDDEDDTNPFGKDDEHYDDAKNPFADEAGA